MAAKASVKSASPERSSISSRPMSSSGRLSFWTKIGYAFAHPHKLYDAVEHESIGQAFVYYLLLLLLSWPIMFLGLWASFSIQEALASFSGTDTLFAMLNFSPISLALIFSSAAIILGPILIWAVVGIMHLGLKSVRAEGSYKDTFISMVYSMPPQAFIGQLPFLGIAAIWSLILQVMGFAKLHKITTGRAVGGFFVGVAYMLAILIVILIIVIAILAASAATLV